MVGFFNTDAEKMEAIKIVMETETHNAIKKVEMVDEISHENSGPGNPVPAFITTKFSKNYINSS